MKEVTPEEFNDAKKKGTKVEYTSLDQSKVDNYEKGDDFIGSLMEFDQLFEWEWEDDTTKILKEKSTGSPFSGLVHIKDPLLNPETYSNSEQKIKFENGIIKFIDSREIT